MKKRISFNTLKKIVESNFYRIGTLHFDENGECHDKQDIQDVWYSVEKYPDDKRTVYKNGSTYLFCISLTRELTGHFWAVYENRNLMDKKSFPIPDYLTKKNPEIE